LPPIDRKKIKFILVISSFFLLLSCSTKEKKTTETTLYSDDFETAKKRVEELKKHITVYSDFSDAEYEILNVNGNFTNERLTIPGASSWDYQFVIKVEKENIEKWISGMVLLDSIVYRDSVPWVSHLNNKMTTKIYTNEVGEYYKRKGDSNHAVVFRNSGLLFRRIVNL